MKLAKPKNQWAKALYILNATLTKGVDMATVLTQFDPTFYKFQTRLSEVENLHPKLAIKREQMPFVSKLNGSSGYFTKYKCNAPKPYLINLYNLINEKGLTNSTKK